MSIHDFLNQSILAYGDMNLKVYSVLIPLAFILGIFILLKIIRKALFKILTTEKGKIRTIYSFVKYCILVLATIVCMQMLGFNLSILVAGSAALLVGVGLGLQNLFSDFVSGVILLVGNSIKINDVIELNGMVCRVQEINLRTTTVLTRDDKYIILPNTDLTRNQLINWTHSAIDSRFEVNIGVDYSSDVHLVMKVLKETADRQEGILKHPAPFVRFTDYGESALHFSVLFWSNETFRVENIKSELRVKIFDTLKENGITIPFPQRVLHMKSK